MKSESAWRVRETQPEGPVEIPTGCILPGLCEVILQVLGAVLWAVGTLAAACGLGYGLAWWMAGGPQAPPETAGLVRELGVMIGAAAYAGTALGSLLGRRRRS